MPVNLSVKIKVGIVWLETFGILMNLV